MFKVFQKGLFTGLFLQLAVGPVFFFITSLTAQKGFLNGAAGVLAVTAVDYFYIILSIFGIGKILEKKRAKNVFGIIGAIVLVIFGLIILKEAVYNTTVNANYNSLNLFSSFMSVLLLTLSSPMTIIFFTSIFATKAIENKLTKKELYAFGFGTGMATFLFMGSFVIIFSLVKGFIPILLIQFLNVAVGFLLVMYGIVRCIKIIKNKN